MQEFEASESDLKKLVEAQATIIDLLGSNKPFSEFLVKLCELFSEQLPGSTVSILVPTNNGDHLVAGLGLAIFDDTDAPHWEIPIDEGAGASGTAAFRMLPVITADIATDPLWDTLRERAISAGLRSAWSNPLIGSDNQLLGVLTVLWPEPATPEPHQTWLMSNFARVGSTVVERYRLQESISDVLADERRAIAQDLHDDPIQAVTAASLRVQRLAQTATPEQTGLLADVQQSLSGAIDRMRSMLFELHPPTLDDEGLASAIELYLYERFDPIDVDWELDDRIESTPNAATQSLAYRLTREALSNVAKHSRATRVSVSLTDSDNGIHVRVTDNGIGCDIETALHGRAGHFGTVSSRHLAQRASGQWKIDSTPGAGTIVEFWVPTGRLS